MAKRKGEFELAPFFAFRRPLLPFDAWQLETAREVPGEGSATLDDRYTAARRMLGGAMARAEVREAVYLASPSLYEAWSALSGTQAGDDAGPTSGDGAAAYSALMRYFGRMCTRSTPFGLFAGHGTGTWAENTELAVGANERCTRRTQPDNGFLARMTTALVADPAVRPHITWHANSSLYAVAPRGHRDDSARVGANVCVAGDGYRYLKEVLDGEHRRYQLVWLEDTIYASAAIEASRSGRSFRDLVEVIRSTAASVEDEVTEDDAAGFVADLIDAQVLVARQGPICSGDDPLGDVLSALPAAGPAQVCVEALRRVEADLKDIDNRGIGCPVETYESLFRGIEHLPGIEGRERLFQVDLFLHPERATLGRGFRRELESAISIAQRMAAPPADPLQEFKREFADHFGDQLVPLMVALDPDAGIGKDHSLYSPLLEKLPLGADPKESRDPAASLRIELGRGQTHLLSLVRKHGDSAEALELGDRDLDLVGGEVVTPLPDAFSAMVKIFAPSAESIDRGDYTFRIVGGGGPSASKMLGRFCYGDSVLRDLVQSTVAAEEALRADVVFAEMIHLPEGRMANVIARPAFRNFEIEFLGRSSAANTTKLPLSDLYLRHQLGELQLVSKSLRRVVHPRLSNAHNTSFGVRVYTFLSQLAVQNAGGVGFEWGPLGDLNRYLPRLTHKRLILAPAQWRIDAHEIRMLSARDLEARHAYVEALRHQRQFPRFLVLADGDNRLPIDLDNPMSVDAVVDVMRNRTSCIWSEMLGAPEDLPWSRGTSRFHSEFVFAFTRRAETAKEAKETKASKEGEEAKQPAAPLIRRSGREHELMAPAEVIRHLPGSQWLSCKIYGPPNALDSFATQRLYEFAVEQRREMRAEAWFFLRYGDPKFHLRLRFRGQPGTLLGQVLPRLCALLTAHGLGELHVDTYTPEVARYGGPGCIHLAEEVFGVDSAAVLEGLRHGGDDADVRWRLCLLGVDALLSRLGKSLDEKWTLLKRLQRGYRHEFGESVELVRALGERYRSARPELWSLMTQGPDPDTALAPAFSAMCRVLDEGADTITALQRALADVTLAESDMAVTSILHMHTNRIFLSDGRAHELVIYDWLTRQYEEMRIRSRQQQPDAPRRS